MATPALSFDDLPVRLVRPSQSELDRAAQAQRHTPYSYDEVGGTRGEMPQDYAHDASCIVLGRGEPTWQRAVSALRGWKQFDLSWVRLLDPSQPIEEGTVVAFTSHQLGVWMLNVCRVAYVVDEDDGTLARFGFAYGTLAAHAVQGEEQFLLTWDRSSDVVTFAITKFSRPGHPVIKLLNPLARRIQRKFSEEALERMRIEVTP